MLRKSYVFTRFLRFGHQPCAHFGSLETHFRHFPSLGADPKILILKLPVLFFNPSLAQHNSKMSLLGHPKLCSDISWGLRGLKYSFWGFRNSFGHFQWPIPKLILGISRALAQKWWHFDLFWFSMFIFGISRPSTWPENAHFEIPKAHLLFLLSIIWFCH